MKSFVVWLWIAGLATLSWRPLQAQTVWTNGAGDQLWSDQNNWTPAVVPNSSSVAVQIGTQPTGNEIGVDTGATTIETLTFNSSLTGTSIIEPVGLDTLTVDGNIANLSNYNQTLLIPVIAGASATYTGVTADLTFSQLAINTSDIAINGTVDVTTTLAFTINSGSSYGQIGSVDVSGATINISTTTYTGNLGDTFDFTTGNFDGATLGTLPTLSSGLSWDTANFSTDGILSVVPEPSDTGLLALGLCLLGALSAFPRLRQRLLPASLK